jgi:hypothetical protein
MARKPRKPVTQGRIEVAKEDDFDSDSLPKPGDPPGKSVFSLRLDRQMVAAIDRAREVYAERVAAAVRRPTVRRESRSGMIRILLEDGLRLHLGDAIEAALHETKAGNQ